MLSKANMGDIYKRSLNRGRVPTINQGVTSNIKSKPLLDWDFLPNFSTCSSGRFFTTFVVTNTDNVTRAIFRDMARVP
jgi:hypothetical protein